MFNKNLNSINKNNAGFKQKMLETRFDNSNIQPLMSKDGQYIIALNNVPLDSPINPLDETKNIFETKVDKMLTSSDIVVIFGLGLGYLLKRIFVETQAKIILFEPNINVLRFALEYVDFCDILSSNRLFVSNDSKEILNKIQEIYFENTKINLVFNEWYLKLYTQLLNDFSQKLINAVNSKKNDIATIRHQGKLWTTNIIHNYPHYKDTLPINYLSNQFNGKTVMILCAGPSLKQDINLIKQNKQLFTIIAINKVVNFLLKNDIIPDFVIASDSYDITDTLDFSDETYKQINFIFSAKCATDNFNCNSYSKWLYYPKNSSLIDKFIQKIDNNLLFDKTSGTTSIYAYECAKMMGFKNIIFSGLDLAYKEDEHYCSDIELNSQDIKNKIKFTTVKNVQNQTVTTRNDYALFVKQFEETLENNNDCNVYNLTTFGAYIEGMKYLSFDNISKEINPQANDIKPIIDKVIEEKQKEWKIKCNQIKQFFDNSIKNMKFVNITQIKNTTNKKQKLNLNFPINYYEISQDFIQFLTSILENPILGEYFQIELLEFLDKMEHSKLASYENLQEIVLKEQNLISEVEAFINNFKN